MIFGLKHYASIDDMPVENWLKIQETNDVSWMLIKKKKISVKESIRLALALKKITDEYIDTYGVSYEHKKILSLKRDIRVKEIELVVTQNRVHKTFINVLKAELKKLIQDSQKTSTGSVKVHIWKYTGIQIDFKKMSVREFYDTLKEMKSEYKSKK